MCKIIIDLRSTTVRYKFIKFTLEQFKIACKQDISPFTNWDIDICLCISYHPQPTPPPLLKNMAHFHIDVQVFPQEKIWHYTNH